VAELRQVPGVTGALYAQLAPVLTVHSGQRQVNVATAPEAVLQALPQFGPEQIEALLEARAAQPLDPMAAMRVSVFSIRSKAVTASGARFVRTAIVQRSGDRRAPYRILAWGQGDRGGGAESGEGAD
jgi:general secretion pathway protein K